MPLILALWSVGVLAAVTLSSLWGNATVYRMARNASTSAVMSMRAEAAMNKAIFDMMKPSTIGAWRVDGTAREVFLDGTPIYVSIQDQTGLIDVNQADAPTLVRLFASGGADQRTASELSERVAYWRQPLHQSRMIAVDIAKRGKRPRYGPFQSIDELKMVAGMTPGIFDAIRESITVHSGRAFVDKSVAPRRVLLLLDDGTAHKAAAVLASRLTGRGHAAGDDISRRGRAFAVRASIKGEQGAEDYTAILRIGEDHNRPLLFLKWARG